ncbi:Positive regulator of CheA protein activity (CheW) [hydrothermal vent metagenome]|uniref:Chemotaxis protein CheW n=1 Tax=hydrothermal vent metagenome TaxID=652676 RepID=A0A3B0WCC4_9ZZZZ
MSESKQEFLTFVIGSEEYAVKILRVQEIRGWQEPSPLPSVPSFVKGVVNLRGTVVPIIDLREKFQLQVSYDDTTVVIVVHVITSSGERIVGLVVDAVSDVHTFDLSKLQPAPDISSSLQNQFVVGLGTIKAEAGLGSHNVQSQKELEEHGTHARMVILIDIDKLVSEGLIESIVGNESTAPVENG